VNIRRLRAYWGVLRIAARENNANPKRIAASVALGIGRILLLAAIYEVAYRVASNETALSYENAVWSIGLYFGLIMGLQVRNVFRLVEQDIVSGAVETELVRPLDWRMVKFCQQLGKNGVECLALITAFTVTLLLAIGPPAMHHFTPGFLAGYGVLVVLSVITAGIMFVMVGLTAFWLNDAESVHRLVDKTVMIFGGAFVPVALMPETIQSALRYSPFGVFGASTQLFSPGLATHLAATIAASVAWAGVLYIACQWVWQRASRRIEVNGG
jgi:ABC-2 type transport system permease protein